MAWARAAASVGLGHERKKREDRHGLGRYFRARRQSDWCRARRQDLRRQSLWCRAPWQVIDRAHDLGARDSSTELGASINGAELRVHFLNSFRQRSICEKLFQKKSQIVKKSVAMTTGYCSRVGV